ncbi:MAG: antibiotic biosynthesis monooxygenase [Gammaproteobacteria bacterium]|nr:antibiotic biosynthesis monooxygenase [Gammaproteobacteria bacterium]
MALYCRIFHFDFKPGNDEAVRILAEHAREIMQQQEGFRSVTFFADYENGQGGAMSLWDSTEAIEAYIKGSSGLMRVASAGLFLGRPKSMIAEVLDID